MNLVGRRIAKDGGSHLACCDPVFDMTEWASAESRPAWSATLDDGVLELYSVAAKVWANARVELVK